MAPSGFSLSPFIPVSSCLDQVLAELSHWFLFFLRDFHGISKHGARKPEEPSQKIHATPPNRNLGEALTQDPNKCRFIPIKISPPCCFLPSKESVREKNPIFSSFSFHSREKKRNKKPVQAFFIQTLSKLISKSWEHSIVLIKLLPGEI